MLKTPISSLALVAALGVAACDNSEYETQISDLEGQLSTAEGEVGELGSQLEAATGEVGELQTQLSDAQTRLGEMETLEQELEQARSRNEELQSQLAEAQEAQSAQGDPAQAEELRAELEQARARIEELQSQQASGGLAAASASSGAVETDVASPEAVGAGPGVDAGPLRDPLAAAISALRSADQELAQLRDMMVGEGYEDIDIQQPRSYLEAAGQEIAEAARAAGIDPQSLEP